MAYGCTIKALLTFIRFYSSCCIVVQRVVLPSFLIGCLGISNKDFTLIILLLL